MEVVMMSYKKDKPLIMRLIRYCVYAVLQLSWGFPASALGFIVFLANLTRPHVFFHGCILTRWKNLSGLSLGLFIFVPEEGCQDADPITVHEYGHTLQNLITGPFYLILGFISFVWANAPKYVRMRREHDIPYSSCFTEEWANILGEKALHIPSIEAAERRRWRANKKLGRI